MQYLNYLIRIFSLKKFRDHNLRAHSVTGTSAEKINPTVIHRPAVKRPPRRVQGHLQPMRRVPLRSWYIRTVQYGPPNKSSVIIIISSASFLFLYFSKKYRNIFLVLDFTVLYTYR